MEKSWDDEFASDEDVVYEEAVRKIRDGVLKESLTFREAASRVVVDDRELESFIMEDALKVLIAEMHFVAGKTVKEVSSALGIPIEVVERAKNEMLKEVEAEAIEKYRSSTGQVGNA